ncbi:MAG: hypothetical protein ABSH28_04440 [Acidobacteriota bacterium]|jgi:hypothetical protein
MAERQAKEGTTLQVVVTAQWLGQTLRVRHQYSDYAVFLVESRKKIEPPKIKKAP